MNCVSCGRAHKAGARFCGGCGKPLTPRCSACGAESEPDAQFCETCGAAFVARRADDAVARKVVTIVFADLIGSTALHERLDAESVRRLMDRYYRALHAAVEAHGGTVVKLLGDGVMAAFGVPRVAEDDAFRAVRAAVGMQRAFHDLVREQTGVVGGIGLRVAVNTGEVVVSDDHADVVGDPVNVAARLQQEAHDGDVLIGESTRRLVGELVTLAPFGALTLKGRSETVAAYRVVSLERPAGAPATAFVGRDEELRRIMAVHDAAVAARAARLTVILGSPGLGKSRLIAEFARRLGQGATVLTARCDAAGGATFAPLAEALRTLLGIDDGAGGDAVRAAIDAVVPGNEPERARIADGITALLAGTPASPEETFFVVRRLLAALGGAQPVVLVIDDLQWAEPLLLDLTEHLVQWTTDVPLLVLVAARPELRDARSSLATPGGLVADVVTLAGLDAGAATRLAANVIGADALPAAIAGRVLATSEGNPLFVGELVRMLVQDGALRREGDHWTAGVELAGLEMPPTIHALLAARIERLRPEERTVLERAAVVGRQFSRAAVAHLLPREMTDLDARLESLRRSELIEPDAGWFLGEPLLRFHHVLIRDAAYRRLLKGTRAELHGRYADWLEGRVGETVEHDETIGWHLEHAHQHLRELGPIDERGRSFGERAARHLAAAGRRALGRDDLPLAASLLGRALDRLDPADPARADLALDWCEALLATGDVGPAAGAIDELGRFTGGSDRLRAWHTCFAAQLAVLTDPQALRATSDAVAAAAGVLASSGDAAGEAKAHFVHALALARLGKVGACEAALDRALAVARRARDRRRANAVLAGAPLAALWGPSPVTRASGRCLDVVRVLRITQGAPAVEAVALRCQAVLEALRGRIDAARRMIASSRRMVEELGITHRLLEADVFAGLVELLDGDAPAAERRLRAAYDGLRAHGLAVDAAQAAALLGRALLAQDRAGEAEALSHESEALAGDDLKAAIAWRGVRAEALARRGEHASAIDFARAAVDIAAATDALLDHADARLALASALRAAGRGDEADAQEARAIELWDAKGATLLAERARGAPSAGHADRAADELTAGGRRSPFENAAARAMECYRRCWNERDWDGVLASFAPTVVLDDRRALFHLQTTGDDFLANQRFVFAMKSSRWHSELLATRGERLALSHRRLTGEVGDGSEIVVDTLSLVEVDADDRYVALVVFDPDRLDAAYAELDDRYAAGEGAPYAELLANHRALREAAATGNRDAVARLLPDDFSTVDHRRFAGTGARMGRDEYVASLGFADGLHLRSAVRLDHLPRVSAKAIVGVMTWHGTRDGGHCETSYVLVSGHDGKRIHVLELFDLDRLDAALARYEALSAAATARIANAATRSGDRFRDAWDARDWQRVVATCAAGFRYVDRRSLVHLDLDRSQYLEILRTMFAMDSSRITSDVLATRGDRLSLARGCFAGTHRAVGPSESEFLMVTEVDEHSDRVAAVMFDGDALDAAYGELDRRYAAGEAAACGRVSATMRAFTRALASRDWDVLAAQFAPDLVVNDHRRLGWETLRGLAAYVQALRSLVDLAPDARLRLDHVRTSDRGLLWVGAWLGTREGGAFEAPWIVVSEHDSLGRVRGFDQYDLDQLDAAEARFDAIGSGAARDPLADPLRIPPNAATRAMDRWQAAFAARDWDALGALCAPDLVFDDRRRGSLVIGDRDTHLASSRVLGSMGFAQARSTTSPVRVLTRTVLATAGDRLALERARWWTGPDDAPDSDGEVLSLHEVDAEGHVVAIVTFDVEDRRAARAELLDRYARSDAGRWTPAARFALQRALDDHDLERIRALLPDDLVFHDHRRAGAGRLESADAYVAWVAALFEQSPDAAIESLYDIATEKHGTLSVGRTWGTLAGGGAFESAFVRVELYRGDRLAGAELFEVEDIDVARARFEALRPDPTRIRG